MRRAGEMVTLTVCAVALAVAAAAKAPGKPPVPRPDPDLLSVDCNAGERVATALAAVRAQRPTGRTTITVRGTCSEFVDVHDFERLTLQGVGDAVIAPTMTSPDMYHVPLGLRNSRDILVSDLTLKGLDTCGVLFEDCQDCQLAHSSVEGQTVVTHKSRIKFMDDVFDAGTSLAALFVADNSVVHMGNSAFVPGIGTQAGLYVLDGAIVKLWGTTIQGFAIGVRVVGASVHMYDVSKLFPGVPPGDPTVVIADSSQVGVKVSDGGRAQLGDVQLTNNGNGSGAGILAERSSIVTLASTVEISGGAGSGLLLKNGSHALLAGRIVNAAGNGLVVLNDSTATAASAVEILGSGAQDIFCDTMSLLSGTSRITGVTKITCPNQNSGDTVPLPTPE
jgi:hypothetical protein